MNIYNAVKGILVIIGISLIPQPFSLHVGIFIGLYVALRNEKLKSINASIYGAIISAIGALPVVLIEISSSYSSIEGPFMGILAMIEGIGVLLALGIIGSFIGYIMCGEIVMWKSNYWMCPQCSVLNPNTISLCPNCNFLRSAYRPEMQEVRTTPQNGSEGVEIIPKRDEMPKSEESTSDTKIGELKYGSPGEDGKMGGDSRGSTEGGN